MKLKRPHDPRDRRRQWHRRCYPRGLPISNHRTRAARIAREEENMSVAAIIGILVGLAAIGGAIWLLTERKRQTKSLQSLFGPEYSRTVGEVGSQRRAERELVKRQERVEALEIRPLLADQRNVFTQQWRNVQTMFVDDPVSAVTRADALVEEVMKTRGYPIADFDQRAADLSVHHSRVVQNYRAAREIAERRRRNAASTEDLRKAMVYYRELFEDLLEDRESVVDRPVERSTVRSADRSPRAEEPVRVDSQPVNRVSKDLRP